MQNDTLIPTSDDSTSTDSTSTDSGTRADSHRASLIGPGEGAHHHFLDHLATIVVPNEAMASGMSMVAFDAPQGFGPPLHVHQDDDEIIVLIDGRMRVCVDGLDEIAEAGAVAVLPRGIPHAFQVLSDSARFLSISANPAGPSRFDDFVGELGTPIPGRDLPPAEGIDPGRVAMVGGHHGIEVLGPPLPVA